MKKITKAYYNPKALKEEWEIVEILGKREKWEKELDDFTYTYLIKRDNGEIVEVVHLYIIK